MDTNSVIVIKEATNMITTFWPEIIGSVITGCFILLTAYFAYKFGLKSYFAQREHEYIMKRYIDEGVGQILDGVNRAFRIFSDNNANALMALGQLEMGLAGFEGLTPKMDYHIDRFGRGEMLRLPYYKLNHLLGDNIFSSSILKLFALVGSESAYLDVLLQFEIKDIVKGQANDAMKKIEKLDSKLGASFDKVDRYRFIVDELQMIASILEKEKSLTWADLREFKNRPEIKESVKRSKRKFAELEKAKAKQKR